MVGRGSAGSSQRHTTSKPLRLMFSVYIEPRTHSAGEVTWHRSFISILGLSRRFIFFISARFDTLDFSPRWQEHQYRKWAIRWCFLRIAGSWTGSPEFSGTAGEFLFRRVARAPRKWTDATASGCCLWEARPARGSPPEHDNKLLITPAPSGDRRKPHFGCAYPDYCGSVISW